MTDSRIAAYVAATARWPFIREVEGRNALPDCTLFAYGYRETGLTLENGDSGHGHGVWQLDDRSHTIPQGFDHDVEMQAAEAGQMIGGLLLQFGRDFSVAACAYNAGVGAVRHAISTGRNPNSVTTGGNYGSDVSMNLLVMHRAHLNLRAGRPADSL